MAKLFNWFTILACLVAVYFENANGCHPRHIGGETQVCVCSAQHNCDGELKHLNDISNEKGAVTSFVTSKAGARLDRHSHHFVHTNPTAIHANFEVEINRGHKHQKIMGFGGAFPDLTGYNIARMPKDLQSRIIKDYFSPDGIEYRFSRVTIGGSDESTRLYSLDDHAKDESLNTFALQPEDLNYKIPYMTMAMNVSRNPLKFFASAWSAPAWMKTNNLLNHGGFLKGHPGEKYYKAFANYTIRFLEEYKKHHIDFWGLTALNEPGFGNDHRFPYNSMGMSSHDQRDWIKKDLGPELHKRGFGKLALMHYDFNIDHVEEYANAILGDPESAKYVAGTGYHWYANKNVNRDVLGRIAKRYPDKFVLGTEACLFGYKRATSLGSWHNFNEYAEDIIRVLNEGVHGWVEWNLALDVASGGPSWMHQTLHAPVHVSDDGHEYYRVPLFYAMGHFSKFVLPDSVRVEAHAKHDANGKNVLVTAFERPDKSIVLSVLNKNNHKVTMKVHDPTHGFLVIDLVADSMDTLIWH